MDDEERERLEDMKERDEYAQRLKEKDKDKTKSVRIGLLIRNLNDIKLINFITQMVEDRSSKGDTEATRRRNLADDRESRAAALPDIRDRSRQEYLKLREQQRLELLRQEIQDEAFLFGDQRLSKKEIAEHEYKKEVLRLAEARMKIDAKEDGYVMPEGKDVLHHSRLHFVSRC